MQRSSIQRREVGQELERMAQRLSELAACLGFERDRHRQYRPYVVHVEQARVELLSAASRLYE